MTQRVAPSSAQQLQRLRIVSVDVGAGDKGELGGGEQAYCAHVVGFH